MRKYNTIGTKTKEELQEIANSVTSLASFLEKLGLKSDGGGSYSTAKRHLQKLNIDTNHWKGQGWSKNNQLKNWTDYLSTSAVKKNLLKTVEYKCSSCLLTEWNNKYICLELHHVDGDATNNHISNLRLLCPNCHSQTSNFKNRKRIEGT